MTQSKLLTMEPTARAAWLDSVSPLSSWALGDDIFCLHCDAVFKAEDVACDADGDPTCPLCKSSTPLDFHVIPWWRDDLIDEDEEVGWSWKGAPVSAIQGKPRTLPKPQ